MQQEQAELYAPVTSEFQKAGAEAGRSLRLQIAQAVKVLGAQLPLKHTNIGPVDLSASCLTHSSTTTLQHPTQHHLQAPQDASACSHTCLIAP